MSVQFVLGQIEFRLDEWSEPQDREDRPGTNIKFRLDEQSKLEDREDRPGTNIKFRLDEQAILRIQRRSSREEH
ncbi:hypothetical protein KFK09_017878 [Dendrobium nobile]|uniref:Uncharacterized protein n=1 Tax=Dendrobium nobile TaxID=94219 RepID=A0A8T3AU60_DENNO|nr:hypothetical protein KFK09_017878 [Dendrobium nobile]